MLANIDQAEQFVANIVDLETRLVQAVSDYERMDIRDQARRAQVAATLIGRMDLATKVSRLVILAEYDVAHANPAMSNRDAGKLALDSGHHKETTITKQQMSVLRKAYNHINTREEMVTLLSGDETIFTRKMFLDLREQKIRERNNQNSKYHRDRMRDERASEKAAEVVPAQQNEVAEDVTPEVPLPVSTYSTIVLDPPWPAGEANSQYYADAERSIGWYYPQMSLKEIVDLPIPSLLKDDATVFLWTINSFIRTSYDILEAWGLSYIFTMVWVKASGPRGPLFPAYNAEYVLVGRRGNPKFLESHNFVVANSWPRRGHSEKPVEFYELLDRVTAGPRLDMFARSRHKGFDAWGDEVDKL